MWIFSCIVFVIAALVEYAVLIKIRYGNASARLVKARLMLMAKKQPATEGEVGNFKSFPFKVLVAC